VAKYIFLLYYSQRLVHRFLVPDSSLIIPLEVSFDNNLM